MMYRCTALHHYNYIARFHQIQSRSCRKWPRLGWIRDGNFAPPRLTRPSPLRPVWVFPAS